MSQALRISTLLIAWALSSPIPALAADETEKPLPAETASFLKTHCVRCHQGERPKGKLDLTQFQSAGSMTSQSSRWSRILARVAAGKMPPDGSEPLKPDEREQFIAATRQAL